MFDCTVSAFEIYFWSESGFHEILQCPLRSQSWFTLPLLLSGLRAAAIPCFLAEGVTRGREFGLSDRYSRSLPLMSSSQVITLYYKQGSVTEATTTPFPAMNHPTHQPELEGLGPGLKYAPQMTPTLGYSLQKWPVVVVLGVFYRYYIV